MHVLLEFLESSRGGITASSLESHHGCKRFDGSACSVHFVLANPWLMVMGQFRLGPFCSDQPILNIILPPSSNTSQF
jgi:hypothetical protein